MSPTLPAPRRPGPDATSAPSDRPTIQIHRPPVVQPLRAPLRRSKYRHWPVREWPAWTDQARYVTSPDHPLHWPAWTDQTWSAAGKEANDAD